MLMVSASKEKYSDQNNYFGQDLFCMGCLITCRSIKGLN